MKRRSPEHDIQAAFFRLVLTSPKTRHLLIYAVPNAGGYVGGFAANAVRASRMKAEGVRRGPPDVNVDVPSSGFHGLRIEFKAGRGRLTPEQAAWGEALTEQGYYVTVCRSALEAWAVLADYLRMSL